MSGTKPAKRAAKPRRFKPYLVYKNPGIEWLGECPAHWEVNKTTWLFAIGSGTTPKSEDLGSYGGETPWITTSELRESVVFATEKYVTEAALREYSSLKVHPAGSVAVAMYGATIGRLGILGIDATVNQACCVFSKPRGIRMDFWFYWLQMRRPYLISLGYGGGQPNLSQDLLRSVRVPTPTVPEQRTIATFLDRETARIDALVAKKERLVELLQEQRTALITRAVTKGLEPNVPMKDSGAEWLGEIPASWEVKHLRWAIMFQRGHDLPTDEREDGQVPIVSSSGISSTHSRAIAKAPGIVTGRYGTIGHFRLVTEDYWPLNTTLYSIDLRGNNPRFLRHMLEHLSPLFLLNAVKFAVPSVDRNDIHPTTIALPPLPDQLKIAEFLDTEHVTIDTLLAKVREAIDRLKELRIALISAAVTGKIDVREDAA